MAANLEQLVEDLSQLTVIEAAELSKLLEDKWGVSAAAPVAVAAAAPAEGAAAEEEKTEFDLILVSFGEKKINVIKEVRAITGARAQGGEGPRRGRAQPGQGGRVQGRGRRDQGEARGSRSDRRGQVVGRESTAGRRDFRAQAPRSGAACPGLRPPGGIPISLTYRCALRGGRRRFVARA